MKQFLILVFGSLFILNSLCAQDKEITKEIDKIFSKEFAQDEPGGSILVKKAGEIVFQKSYGISDVNTKEKITENTIFNTGSISKTFVSNGILILKERGLLSLDDNLSKYFDDFENPEIAKQIKIKHLLSHSSGLPDNRRVRDNSEFYKTAKDKENFEPLKRTKTLNFQPGEKFEYSNPAFNGLALIIEKLSNQAWQDFIIENIFEPSGMTHSKITNGPHPESGVSHGYYKNKRGEFIEYDYGEVPTFAAAGNGGVWCSVLDLAKYEDAIQENIFLSKDLIVESRMPLEFQNWSQTVAPYLGYSWFTSQRNLFRSDVSFDVDFVYHTGSQGGFNAFYVTIPEEDILFVGLFNIPVKNFNQLIIDSVKLFQNSNWLEKE